ncbi:hypothetical protein [uncultured Aquimarina sp.]|uniref:hypothetical protein n=1 Tax=uncultured Aquimarina sp. TaxID=575652 RepID=UPI0026242C26|nr:hypothetical protein [uncultured Aquimarina sp.]
MKTQTDKTQESQSSITPRVSQEPGNGGTVQLMDNRTSSLDQRKLRSGIDGSGNKNNPVQRKRKGSSRFQKIAADMGAAYGVDTSDLNATHNSSFPIKLNADATIQGSNIHFAPNMDTDYNIRHEVSHAIDNKLNGTPKGDKTVNGQKVDTTREKVVDTMAENSQPAKRTHSKNSIKQEASNLPVQRLPSGALNRVVKKLRKGGFEFDDDDVIIGGNRNVSRLTIQQMEYGGLDFTNVVFQVNGRMLDGDALQSVDLDIETIAGDNLNVGGKYYRVALNDLNMNMLLIKKIQNLGAILRGMIINGIVRWLPMSRRFKPDTSVPYPKYGLNMLGAGSGINIGRLQIDTLSGSVATRIGKGGYTGAEGQVQTQSQVEDSILINDLELNVEQVPGRNQEEFITNVGIGNLRMDQNKRKLIKRGQRVNKPKTEQKQIDVQDLNFRLHQNENDFNLSNLTFNDQNQNTVVIRGLPFLNTLTISDLESDIDPNNGNGDIQANISIRIKNLPFVNINFQITIDVRNWNVVLTEVLDQIRTGLRSNRIPNAVSNMILEKIRTSAINYENPDVLRRTLEVFDPDIPGSDRDVLITGATVPNDPTIRVIGINIARLFEYHLGSKIRNAVGR